MNENDVSWTCSQNLKASSWKKQSPYCLDRRRYIDFEITTYGDKSPDAISNKRAARFNLKWPPDDVYYILSCTPSSNNIIHRNLNPTTQPDWIPSPCTFTS